MAKLKGSDIKGFFKDTPIIKVTKKHKSHKHSMGGKNWLKGAIK